MGEPSEIFYPPKTTGGCDKALRARDGCVSWLDNRLLVGKPALHHGGIADSVTATRRYHSFRPTDRPHDSGHQPVDRSVIFWYTRVFRRAVGAVMSGLEIGGRFSVQRSHLCNR